MDLSLFSLKGRTAIVTGASRGLGKQCALALADAGANVVLASRTMEELKKTAVEVEAKGVSALPIEVDILKLEDIKNMVSKSLERFGKIDILVNNSGVGKISLVENLKEKDWDWVINVNLKGTFLCCQAIIPEMKKNNYGRIINMASLGGLRGSRYMGVYNASKAGVIKFSEALGLELVNNNINVNSICPGMILTDMNRPFFESEAGKKEAATYPMKRPGRIEEISGAVIYLASEASSYVTGTQIIVDGGQRWKIIS